VAHFRFEADRKRFFRERIDLQSGTFDFVAVRSARLEARAARSRIALKRPSSGPEGVEKNAAEPAQGP
jgi:hypothetical protein